MKNFMYMRQLIRSICLSLLLSLYCSNGFSQELIISNHEIESFIKEILEDKRLSYVYSYKGYLFSDFLVTKDEGKVVSIFRKNGKIISNGTPLLFLDKRNQHFDSLFFYSWPASGNPETFSSLSRINESLVFIPNRLYPNNIFISNIKRPTKGYIQDFNVNSKIAFYDFSKANGLLGDSFSYNSKKDLLHSNILKKSFHLDSILLRFSDNKLAVYDKAKGQMYVFDRNTSDFKSFEFPKAGIINFEFYDANSMIFSFKNIETNRYEIRIKELNNDKSQLIYNSTYYIPRVKSVGDLIYFEIAAKFADSDYYESILLKLVRSPL